MPTEIEKKEIIDNLLDGTKKDYIKWTITNSMFNKDSSHEMSYTSDDEETIFDIRINLNENLSDIDGDNSYLYIKNTNLVNGRLQISGYRHKGVNELQKLIFDKFVKPTTPHKAIKLGVLTQISKSINNQQHRENQIDNILNDNELQKSNTGRTEEEVIKEYIESQKKLKNKKKKNWLF